jgi:hypothetical protein
LGIDAAIAEANAYNGLLGSRGVICVASLLSGIGLVQVSDHLRTDVCTVD